MRLLLLLNAESIWHHPLIHLGLHLCMANKARKNNRTFRILLFYAKLDASLIIDHSFEVLSFSCRQRQMKSGIAVAQVFWAYIADNPEPLIFKEGGILSGY